MIQSAQGLKMANTVMTGYTKVSSFCALFEFYATVKFSFKFRTHDLHNMHADGSCNISQYIGRSAKGTYYL